MSYWDGTQWLPQDDPFATRPTKHRSRARDWLATAVMIIGLVALMIPFGIVGAAHRSGPSVTVACGSDCEVGGTLVVRGSGFTPSAGGQQVILWIGYPDDYCGSAGCHGFYVDPWVESDGTFRVSSSNAILQPGTGKVKAIEYNARRDKWLGVADDSYSAY